LRVFISQPMRGRKDEEITKERIKIIEYLKNKYPMEKIEPIDSYFKSMKYIITEGKTPLWLLGRSIQLLSEAQLVAFAPESKKARGCRIEHECALNYGIPVLDLEYDEGGVLKEVEYE